jgi:hypothetical protein
VSSVPINAARSGLATGPSPYSVQGLASGPTVSRQKDDEDDGITPWRAPKARRESSSSQRKSGGSSSGLIKGATAVGAFLLIFVVRVALRLTLNETLGTDPKKDAVQRDLAPNMPVLPSFGPQSNTRATLSNAQASARPGPGGNSVFGVVVSVDYQFEGNGPRVGETYVWVIEGKNGRAKQPLTPGGSSGSLTGEVLTMQAKDGPFRTYLAIQQGPRLQKITDTVSMPYSSEPAALADSGPPLETQTGPVPAPNFVPQNLPGFGPPTFGPPGFGPPGFGPPGQTRIGPPNHPRIRPPQMPPIPRGPRGPRFRGGPP